MIETLWIIYFIVTSLIIFPLGVGVDRGEVGPVGLGILILILWGPIVLKILHWHP